MKIRKEIGSEYWDIPRGNADIFPKGTTWFLSGRSALSFIICDIKKKHNVKCAALPVWCCDSMIIPFVREGIEVLFYDKAIPKCDILLTMEYFGFIRNKPIDFDGIVIYDVTHSMFSHNMGIKRGNAKDEYFFGSLRKWAGFKTGGFAGRFEGEFGIEISNATDEDYIKLRTRAMSEKEKYLSGKREDKEYFIKTGTYSSKFDFRNARVSGPKEVRELGEYLLFIHFHAEFHLKIINLFIDVSF